MEGSSKSCRTGRNWALLAKNTKLSQKMPYFHPHRWQRVSRSAGFFFYPPLPLDKLIQIWYDLLLSEWHLWMECNGLDTDRRKIHNGCLWIMRVTGSIYMNFTYILPFTATFPICRKECVKAFLQYYSAIAGEDITRRINSCSLKRINCNCAD